MACLDAEYTTEGIEQTWTTAQGPSTSTFQQNSNNDEDSIKCVVFCNGKKNSFSLTTDDGKIEDNQDAFQEFCEYLEEIFNIDSIDIDNWSNNLELHSIDNEHDVEHKNSAVQIEDADDFGCIFEDFDQRDHSFDNATFYFVLEITEQNILSVSYFCKIMSLFVTVMQHI